MKNLITIAFLIIVTNLSAQLYSVSTPFKPITKTTNHGVLHEFIQIDNLAGFDLPMRWIGYVGGTLECPPQWAFGVTDPDSAYAVLNHMDSADFILSDTNTTNNKIVISVHHNGQIGNCDVTFDIFALSDPNNRTTIGFNITVTTGPVGVPEVEVMPEWVLYPNPGNGIYQSDEEIKELIVYTVNGEEIGRFSDVNRLDLTNYPNGIYMVRKIDYEGKSSFQKLVKLKN